jgi:transcriptional activator SPT8
MATSMCSSYLLTGSQDGHIRAYDPWSSANGMQTMTAQQRSVVGLGESINKAGVFRGWWNNEVESGSGEDAWKGLEPVYSLACQSDALWAASGTRVRFLTARELGADDQSGPINLYTLRHSPGHMIHTLRGHQSVVSCLSILPGEQELLSGSWDGTIRVSTYLTSTTELMSRIGTSIPASVHGRITPTALKFHHWP